MYKMYEMIRKQPEALQQAVEDCAEGASHVAKLLKNKRVYLTGCGSSFHAAIYGEYVLRMGGIDAYAVHAMDMLGYTPGLKGSVAVVISHSWKTRTTLKALGMLRKRGITCIGITANRGAKGAARLLRSSRRFDESDCVTMGYTTELLALALIARPGNSEPGRIHRLANSVLDAEDEVRELVDAYTARSRFFFLGAGPDTATAYEAALKMKEGNFSDAEGMQLEQMLHGSISGIDPDDVVFLVAPAASRAHSRFIDAARALKQIGAATIAVTDSSKIADLCTNTIKMPKCSEYTNPMISVIPLQLFAYHLAVRRGADPDLTREDDPRYRNAYSEVRLHLK